jgi:beta-phosphoglucomutase-like phosphatase (HAD superfamily)
VVEDGSSVVQVAKAGEMAALGVARLNDQALLNEAGADLVVTSLDDVAVNALSEGRQPFAEGRPPGQPTAATHKGR